MHHNITLKEPTILIRWDILSVSFCPPLSIFYTLFLYNNAYTRRLARNLVLRTFTFRLWDPGSNLRMVDFSGRWHFEPTSLGRLSLCTSTEKRTTWMKLCRWNSSMRSHIVASMDGRGFECTGFCSHFW